ncbi:MAG TPA: type II toxin-antitoxin system VapB family antitoxin [Anaerolineales bacterium]|nr:type II toxin-antitoxin system VapB family antitoxin [Anaerolineales bacterium]
MALNIKHPEADRLTRQLAVATGETLTTAVLNALRERLERQKRAGTTLRAKDVLREVRLRLSRYPVLDPRTADEIVGYGDRGLPR